MLIIAHEEDTRTHTQQYWDGFEMFCEVDRSGDYLTAGELAALTPDEMRGYNSAIRAKDEATYSAYSESQVR
jgi:hypothetical protein